MNSMIPAESIESKIIVLRGKKVLLDRELAILYGVETRVLKQAVRRNIDRFPEDFMFILTEKEFSEWRSQFVTSNSDRMGLRYAPMAFTEHGISMLSAVLNSPKAIEISILIIRAFIKIREIISSHSELAKKITELEKRLDYHDESIVEIIKALKKLIPVYSNKPKIGF